MEKGGQSYAIKIEKLTNLESKKEEVIPIEIRELLQEYRGIMEEPGELPPWREFSHFIPLKDESQPVNVRSYRYAHFQKEEIKKQVREILDNGLTRPSSSPYSSPVLLVK